MPKLRIGVICGDCSSEYEISLKSACNIIQHIDKSRFEVILLWISKQGFWYYRVDIINNIDISLCQKNNRYISILLKNYPHQFILHSDQISNILNIDIIFPIIHGNVGEDGSLQGLLNIMNIPFVGSHVLGSSICMDKDISKRVLRDSGLLVAPFKTFLIHEKSDINFDRLVAILGLPLFVKPANQGSSIGISKVINYNNFIKAIDIAFSFSNKILVESAIIGRELECAVLGNINPIVSVCGEIVLLNKNNGFYTYNNKYIYNDVQIVIPAKINSIINDKIRRVVLIAFRALNCSGMARIDLFLTLDHQIIINEVNTLPGFSDNSMYPKLWESTGLSRRALITKLIELALDFYRNNRINKTKTN